MPSSQKPGAHNGTESAPHLFRHHTRSIHAVDCQSESRWHRSQRQQRNHLEIRRRSAMELLTRNSAAYSALSAHSNVRKRGNRLRKAPVPRRTEHRENLNLRIVVLCNPASRIAIAAVPIPRSESKIEEECRFPWQTRPRHKNVSRAARILCKLNLTRRPHCAFGI